MAGAHIQELGLSPEIIPIVEELLSTAKLNFDDLDERAVEALSEYNGNEQFAILELYKNCALDYVLNRSSYICGLIKIYRTRKRAGETPQPIKGPNRASIQAILDRTGYSLEVTTGQRKYGGPPPGWGERPQPGAGHEIFIGKIPTDVFEDRLIPLLEQYGTLWDFRLMMDPLTGVSRGFGFANFTTKDAAKAACNGLNFYKLGPNKLKVNISVANTKLFVGNIPKEKSRAELHQIFSEIFDGVKEITVYTFPDNPRVKNRGFCFIQFDSHINASSARKRLASPRGGTIFGQSQVLVDWADPMDEPDDEVMSKVKVLYVRNLKTDIDEATLRATFAPYGELEKVKRIPEKDYAFIHFVNRPDAIRALEDLNGTTVNTSQINVSLAKPMSEKTLQIRNQRRDAQRAMFGGGGGAVGGAGGMGVGGMGVGGGRYGMGGGGYGIGRGGMGSGMGGGGGGGMRTGRGRMRSARGGMRGTRGGADFSSMKAAAAAAARAAAAAAAAEFGFDEYSLGLGGIGASDGGYGDGGYVDGGYGDGSYGDSGYSDVGAGTYGTDDGYGAGSYGEDDYTTTLGSSNYADVVTSSYTSNGSGGGGTGGFTGGSSGGFGGSAGGRGGRGGGTFRGGRGGTRGRGGRGGRGGGFGGSGGFGGGGGGGFGVRGKRSTTGGSGFSSGAPPEKKKSYGAGMGTASYGSDEYAQNW